MKVHITAFKLSGKYYTDETVEIPDTTDPWNYKPAIRKSLGSRLSDMILVGSYPNEVPFLLMP